MTKNTETVNRKKIVRKAKSINKESLKKRVEVELEQAAVAESKPLIQPITSEERFEYSFKKNRDRYSKFPDRLPAKDRMPFPPDEHKHIGLYENKQNLYLLIAHAYNRLMRRTEYLLKENEALKERIAKLEDK